MKKLLSITLVLIMVLSMAACGGGSGGGTGGAGGTGGSGGGDTIKVGWIGALTGDQAPWGTCESQTLQMLIDQKNEAGGILGKKLELVKYDTKGEVNEAINATKRLVSQDKVTAILGPNASGQAIAIAGVLKEAKVADISTVATNPKVTVNDDGSLNEYNFRVCFIDPYQGAVAAGYAIDVLKLTKAAVLYDVTSDYSQGFREFFIETFKKKGGTIVADEAFKAGDTDFRPQLTKIKEANPDVILMPYFYKEVALSANQARDLGINAVLMGGDGWPSDDLFTMAGKSIEGSFVVNHLDYNDPEVKPLQDAYKAKYGENATIELNAYMVNDAFLALCAAIEKAGTSEAEKVAAALTEIEVKGLTGNIKFSKDTHNPEGKEAAIQKITNNEYVFMQKYSPEQ